MMEETHHFRETTPLDPQEQNMIDDKSHIERSETRDTNLLDSAQLYSNHSDQIHKNKIESKPKKQERSWDISAYGSHPPLRHSNSIEKTTEENHGANYRRKIK